MKQLDVKGDRDTHAHAHLADQIDLGGHLAGYLLTIGTALELQEVVVEADLLAVFGRDRNAEGSDDGRLAHQIDVGADGNDAIEGDHDLQQGHGKQILILQVSLNQLLHGFHQRVGCLLIVVILVCRTVGIDDLPQRGQRLIEVQTIAGGRIDLQAHRSLGLEQNGHIQPQESAVHVDVQGQLLLKVQIGSDGGQQTLRTVQGNRHANADAGGDGAVLRGQLDVQLGIGDIGNQCGQGVGAGAVLIVQHLLGVLAGHDGHQQLRLQLVVAGQLAGDGLFDLFELLLAQALLDVHFLGGVNVQLGDVVLGICVVEDDLTGTVRLGFHGFDFRKQHIASQIAALPGIDGSFVAIDFAVVEYDDLPRLEIDLAGHDHLAGNDVALSVVILEDFMLGFIIGIINCIFDVRLAHGGVLGHVVPQDVGQALGELDDFDLLAEHAHRQRVDVLRISVKLHAIFHIQGEGGAGGEARFAVDLCAALGFAHGDFGNLQAGAGFDSDVLQRLGRGHALGQNQADGRFAVGKFNLGNGAGIFAHFLLIGGIHGVEGHALLNGIGIAEGRGACLVHAPAAEGIALLGGVQALHRLGQQILALGKHHRFQLAAAEGFEGDDCRFGFIDKAGVQRHLPVHGTQAGNGGGVSGVLIPGGKDLALQRGGRLGEIHHAAGRDFLGFDARALGDEGYQPLAQHEVHLLAGLQLDDLGVGAGHFKSDFGLVYDGTGGADSQGADGFLHANHAQRAAALDDHFVGALDDDLGKLGAGIHMEIDHIGLNFFTRLCLFFDGGVMDIHAGDFAFAQIDAARCIQRKRRSLDRDHGQALRSRNCEALRQHGADGKIVAQDGDVAQIDLALQGIDGGLRIDHGRERILQQLHVRFCRDGGVRINLRGLLGQISVFREDGQIDAVILEAQIHDALRVRGEIDVCRIFDDVAQHAGNLLARLCPGDFLCKGKHVTGGSLLAADHFGQAGETAGGDDCDRQDRREEFSHQCLHFRPPKVNGRLVPLNHPPDLIPPARLCCIIVRGSRRR